MTVTISPATGEEVQSGEIGRRLREFNYTYVGEYPATEYIRVNAREADGSVALHLSFTPQVNAGIVSPIGLRSSP